MDTPKSATTSPTGNPSPSSKKTYPTRPCNRAWVEVDEGKRYHENVARAYKDGILPVRLPGDPPEHPKA
jgi:hypothetical protein